MLYELLPLLHKLMQTGLAFSALGFVAFSLRKWLAPRLGYDPPGVHDFKMIFDQFYDLLLGPVEREIGTISGSVRATQLLMMLTMGLVIALFAIMLEVWGLIAVTGMSFAGYELFGITPDLLDLYHQVIVAVTLLAMALMARGSERAYWLAQYQ